MSKVVRKAQLSWGAVKFIEAPSSLLLAIVTVTLAVTLISCGVASFFIKMDVSVQGTGVVDYVNGSKDVVAPGNGLVQSLLVKEGETVRKDQLVATLQMIGTTEAQVQRSLERLATERAQLPKQRQLGASLSEPYRFIQDASLQAALFEVTEKQKTMIYNRTVQAQAVVRETGPLKRRRDALAEKLKFIADSSMSSYLEMQRQSLEEERGRLEQQIAAIENLGTLRKYESELEVSRAIDRAETLLRSFSDRHQVKSPIEGEVARITASAGSAVQLQRPILTVLPSGADLIAKINVSSKDIAKIREGYSVLMNIDAFPAYKYGYFSGKVLSYERLIDRGSSTATAPESYLVRVSLNERSQTRKPAFSTQDPSEVHFISGMKIQARVVSKRATLVSQALDRVFGQK